MVHWSAIVTIIVGIIIIAIGLTRGFTAGPPTNIEARGEPLPSEIKSIFRVVFGGELPDSMLYTYTIIPCLVLPVLGAFILIFFLAQNILPSRFAAPLAIVVVLISAYSGLFLKFVFGTLQTFGFYGYLLVWIVLIISATSWGIGAMARGIKGVEAEIKKTEAEIAELEAKIAKAQEEREIAARILREMESLPHGDPKAIRSARKRYLYSESYVKGLLTQLKNKQNEIKELQQKLAKKMKT